MKYMQCSYVQKQSMHARLISTTLLLDEADVVPLFLL